MSQFDSPELGRIQEGVKLLGQLRHLFAAMEDDGERERAWNYLSARFAEFQCAEIPAWEEVG